MLIIPGTKDMLDDSKRDAPRGSSCLRDPVGPLVRYPFSVTSATSRGWAAAPVLSPSWSPGGISHSGGTKAGLDLKVCWGNLSRSPGAFGWPPVT